MRMSPTFFSTAVVSAVVASAIDYVIDFFFSSAETRLSFRRKKELNVRISCLVPCMIICVPPDRQLRDAKAEGATGLK